MGGPKVQVLWVLYSLSDPACRKHAPLNHLMEEPGRMKGSSVGSRENEADCVCEFRVVGTTCVAYVLGTWAKNYGHGTTFPWSTGSKLTGPSKPYHLPVRFLGTQTQLSTQGISVFSAVSVFARHGSICAYSLYGTWYCGISFCLFLFLPRPRAVWHPGQFRVCRQPVRI